MKQRPFPVTGNAASVFTSTLAGCGVTARLMRVKKKGSIRGARLSLETGNEVLAEAIIGSAFTDHAKPEDAPTPFAWLTEIISDLGGGYPDHTTLVEAGTLLSLLPSSAYVAKSEKFYRSRADEFCDECGEPAGEDGCFKMECMAVAHYPTDQK